MTDAKGAQSVITAPAEIQRLAIEMIQRQRQTGLVEEQSIILAPAYTGLDHDTFYTLILRPARRRALQLLTVSYGRHWPAGRRADLTRAFGIPDGIELHFQVIKGWQITKWSYTTDEAKQRDFLPFVGDIVPGRHNYQE